VRLIRNITTCVLAAASIASGAHAQANDPLVMQSENYDGVPFYAGNDGEDSIFYVPCWVNTNGGSNLRINTVTYGLFMGASAPTVDVEVTVCPMTFTPNYDGTGSGSTAYGIGAAVATGTATLAANTDSANAYIQTLTWTWGSTDPSTRPNVPLCMAPNGPNGYGGYWVGLRFTGPNAGDGSTWGYILTNEPTVGRAFNRFGIYTVSSASLGVFYWYGTQTDADGVTREVPCHFYVDVGGLVTDDTALPANYKYGQLCLFSRESGAYWKPYSTSTGDPYTFYISNFVTATAGQVLKPTQITLGVYRGGTSAASVPAFDMELALCAMTWDGTSYGIGSTVSSSTFHFDASSSGMHTEYATWNIPAGSISVPLNTDNATNAGLGGYWVRARFIGGVSTANQGVEIGYAQQVGGSYNGFFMLDNTQTPPALGFYGFGQYESEIYDASGNVIGYRPLPSRFINKVLGTVGSAAPPCPADLNHDGKVNGADLGLMLGSWGLCSGCPADLNGDGRVNGADLGLLLGAWGNCPQ